MSDIDGNAVRVAESDAGAERINYELRSKKAELRLFRSLKNGYEYSRELIAFLAEARELFCLNEHGVWNA
jgi:hypothetical protein